MCLEKTPCRRQGLPRQPQTVSKHQCASIFLLHRCLWAATIVPGAPEETMMRYNTGGSP